MTKVTPWKWRCHHDDLLVAIVLLGIIMTALYAFGILIRPTRMPFRIGFYLFSVMGLVAAVLVLGRQPFEGHDPTPGTP